MRGQSFTIFKMLIGVVFAMGMLLIAYNVSNLRPNPGLSVDILRSTVQFASRAPGKCFERKNIRFLAGELIRNSSFKGMGGISVSFETNLPSGAIECKEDSQSAISYCKIKRPIEATVYSCTKENNPSHVIVNISEPCQSQ